MFSKTPYKMIKKTSFLWLAVFSFLMFSCYRVTEEKIEKTESPEHNTLYATLYNYYAAEYQALTYQAYNMGKERLLEIRKNDPENTKLAVVVDIDETILNNTPYEAKMMLENKGYSSETWTEWCNLGVAEPVPGALEFLKYADSLGFNIFYITNRKKKFVEEGTIANVQKIGFPQAVKDHFLLREGDRSKESRRQAVSENYEIVLLAGDNLGDLYEDSGVFTEREQLMLSHKEDFGKKFLVLPNAMYGTWVSAIGLSGKKQNIDSLLQVMAKSYAK